MPLWGFYKSLVIRIYDLNWKGLWHPIPEPTISYPLASSEFMTWIGRDCDFLSGSACYIRPCTSEFMTWIGRDCDNSTIPWSKYFSILIRIYDLNWKGLWQTICTATPTAPSIYQNLWPELEGIVTMPASSRAMLMTWDQNLWPELEGIVTPYNVSVRSSSRALHQNLWPELEGIVTNPIGNPESRPVKPSEFMTWIGRDCDISLHE